jgi:hypothetical protein
MQKIGIWLIARVFLITIFSSAIQKNLFAPFLSNPNLDLIDPWGAWTNSLGRTDAFPYGFAMYLSFLPAILINRILQAVSIRL